MENLIFSLNATLPIFLTMILGGFFRKVGIMDSAFVAKVNKFVFTAAIPALVFQDISSVDIRESWDGGFVLFCFLVTLISIGAVVFFHCFLLSPMNGENLYRLLIGAVLQSLALLLFRIYMGMPGWHRL